jgi:hypothetical protein
MIVNSVMIRCEKREEVRGRREFRDRDGVGGLKEMKCLEER